MLKITKYLVLVLMIGLFIQGCDSKKKEVAIESITQAEVDLSTARDYATGKKDRLSLKEAEKKVSEAKIELDKKNYDKAKTLADQASQELKTIISKAKELKTLGKQKPQGKKK
jgi:hypothetical protein